MFKRFQWLNLITIFWIQNLLGPSSQAQIFEILEPKRIDAEWAWIKWTDPNSKSEHRIAVRLETTPLSDGAVKVTLLPIEISGSVHSQDLIRFKTAIARIALAESAVIDVLSLEYDRDRGIEADIGLIGIAVPIALDANGELSLTPGLSAGGRQILTSENGLNRGIYGSIWLDLSYQKELIPGWLWSTLSLTGQKDFGTSSLSTYRAQANASLSVPITEDERTWIRFFTGYSYDEMIKRIRSEGGAWIVGAQIRRFF